MMISVSTPGASMSPSTSATRPIAPRVDVGQRVSSTVTISPGDGAAFLARRNEDVHQHAAIERRDVAHAVLVAVVAADDPFVGALEDADDAPFGAPAVLDALDAHDDAIALHRFVEVRARDVDVAAGRFERPFGRDEAVAGRMRLQPADVQIHLFRQAEAMPADLDEVAGADERLDVPLERGPLVARHLENLQQFAHAGGMVHPLAHERENLFA